MGVFGSPSALQRSSHHHLTHLFFDNEQAGPTSSEVSNVPGIEQRTVARRRSGRGPLRDHLHIQSLRNPGRPLSSFTSRRVTFADQHQKPLVQVKALPQSDLESDPLHDPMIQGQGWYLCSDHETKGIPQNVAECLHLLRSDLESSIEQILAK